MALHSAGSAHSPVPVMPSSVPPMEPTSASMEMPFGVADAHELRGVLHVDVEVLLVGAVVHDGGEAGVDALEAGVVGAVVEVQGDGHGEVQGVVHGVHEGGDGLVAGLVLAGAHGALDDEGRLGLLGRQHDGVAPLEVVGVEGADGVVAGDGVVEHLLGIDEHGRTSVGRDPSRRR